jgi:hypothetical protein
MAINTKYPTTTKRVFRLNRVEVRPILVDEEAQWNALMGDHHLLGNANFPGHRIKYVAEHCGKAVALLCFSACAYHLADRDRWLGWSQEQAIKRRHLVVQNSRFLILPGERNRNLSSRVLSLCTKRLPADWCERFGFSPVLLETFVDPIRFHGTCYKAAGWSAVGKTRGFRRDGREFYCQDSTPKIILVKPLRTDAQELLRAEVLPEELRACEKELPKKRVAARLGFKGLRSLFMVLQGIHDPRRGQGKRYPLGCCLAIVTCAVMAGCKGMRDCAEFAAGLTQKQRDALRAWKNPRTGKFEAPKYVTLWRTLSGIDAEEFEQTVNQWFRDEGRLPEAIAIDGKVLRATLNNEDGGICAVSAVSHASSPLFSTKSLLIQKAKKSQQLAN